MVQITCRVPHAGKEGKSFANKAQRVGTSFNFSDEIFIKGLKSFQAPNNLTC